MIFIKNAIKKIGDDCLIINIKANNFFGNEGLQKEDFNQLFRVIKSGEIINLPVDTKINLILCILYYEYNNNKEAQGILKNYLLNLKDKTHKLYTLFNMIEIEIMLQQKTKNELKVLYNELFYNSEIKENTFEFLLKKHYLGYLKYLSQEYEETDKLTIDIISDIDENFKFGNSNFVQYIRIRNFISRTKIFEKKDPEKNRKEIISHLDSLFTLTKNIKEEFAICVGIKMLTFQSKDITSYEDCVRLVEDMLDVLKRETLFGKSHKNILDQYLYLSGLLGYFHAINDNYEGVVHISKKIDKYLGNVEDIMKNINNNSKESKDLREKVEYNNLLNHYKFFNTILKTSINIHNNNLKESQLEIKKIPSLDNKSEIDILNVCILEQDSIRMSNTFQIMKNAFDKWVKKGVQLNNEKILLCYFSLYNQISAMTKDFIEEKDEKKKKSDILQIRQFVLDIIQNTRVQVEKKENEFLRKVFCLPYFKNLFIKMFYVLIYSYFLEGKYREALGKFDDYYKAEKEFELKKMKSSHLIEKIKGDCYFKLNDFMKAKQIYSDLIIIGCNDPMVHFNLGLIYLIYKDNSMALNEMEKALSIFQKEKNIKKVKFVENLISKIKK